MKNIESNKENKIRVFHSWWSLPMRQGRWNKKNQIENTMYITALSVAYAKKNGAYIVCHCDSYMKPYLSELGYDEIIVDLDDIEHEANRARKDSVLMWAAGKFYALQNEPLGSVHIDFDVFLTKEETVKALDFHNFDILYSHIESSADYTERILLRDHIPTVDCDYDYAANVGVIGFNNQDAKDQYINHYMYYYTALDYDTKGDKDLNADLLLEQSYLLQMLESFTSTNIIGDQRTDSVYLMQRNAIDIGFEHLLGRCKYEPFVLNNVKKRLKRIAPDIYNKILQMTFEGF